MSQNETIDILIIGLGASQSRAPFSSYAELLADRAACSAPSVMPVSSRNRLRVS